MDDRGRWTGREPLTRARRPAAARGARRLTALASWGVVAALWAAPAVASPVHDVESAAPDAGACAGVSVVVDFGGLGAPGVRGCAEVESGETMTALDAVLAAGVSVEGTAQWGTAFVCRVDGRPGAEEDIALPDGQTLRESCARTPSQRAYWSLWHADAEASAWRYATTGAGDLDLGAGNVVALVFTTGPDAAISPSVQPAQARSGELPGGWTDRPPASQTPADAGSADRAESTTSADLTDADPTDNASPQAGAETGVGRVPVVAVGLILVGGAGAVVVSRRRR